MKLHCINIMLLKHIYQCLCWVSTDHDHQRLRGDFLFWVSRSLVGHLYTKMHSNAHRLGKFVAEEVADVIAGHHR